MGRWSFEFCGLFMEYQLVVWLKFVTFERIGCGDVLLGLVLEEFDIFLPVQLGEPFKAGYILRNLRRLDQKMFWLVDSIGRCVLLRVST